VAEAIPGVPWCAVVRADNPGPMTLDGTNTYLIRTDEGTVVIDPGPLLPAHVDAVTDTDPPGTSASADSGLQVSSSIHNHTGTCTSTG